MKTVSLLQLTLIVGLGLVFSPPTMANQVPFQGQLVPRGEGIYVTRPPAVSIPVTRSNPEQDKQDLKSLGARLLKECRETHLAEAEKVLQQALAPVKLGPSKCEFDGQPQYTGDFEITLGTRIVTPFYRSPQEASDIQLKLLPLSGHFEGVSTYVIRFPLVTPQDSTQNLNDLFVDSKIACRNIRDQYKQQVREEYGPLQILAARCVKTKIPTANQKTHVGVQMEIQFLRKPQ